MTDRLRMVLAGVVVLLLAVVLWKGLVEPAREKAATARDEQAAAEARALTVVAQREQARAAAERTPDNVRMLKRLAVAVPEKVEAPALIDQLDRTAKRHDVSFDVLKVSDGAASASTSTGAGAAGAAGSTAGDTGGSTSGADTGGSASGGTGGTGTTTGSGGATSTAPAGTTAAPGAASSTTGDAGAAAPGSVPVALTVEIAGRYVDVTRFVRAVQGDVRAGRSGALRAKGRLLRVNAIDLTTKGRSAARRLEGTLDVVAYLLPAEAAASAAGGATPGATTTEARP